MGQSRLTTAHLGNRDKLCNQSTTYVESQHCSLTIGRGVEELDVEEDVAVAG